MTFLWHTHTWHICETCTYDIYVIISHIPVTISHMTYLWNMYKLHLCDNITHSCDNLTHLCMYKMDWRSVNTIARVLNHISLERAGHQHSDKVYGVYITSLTVGLWIKMCNTGDMLCECYHILVHIFLNIVTIQLPHTLLEWWWWTLSNAITIQPSS